MTELLTLGAVFVGWVAGMSLATSAIIRWIE
jgi:hypothetical protein